MSTTRFKICCIQDLAEANSAIEAGAWAVGLVGEMPSGPGPISDAQIRTIADGVRGRVETFLLTSRTDAEGIVAHHESCQTTTLQLVDYVPVSELQKIRAALPDVRLVQVVHVHGPESINEALNLEPFVDVILLDSGDQKLAVKQLGGTGRTHDWSISREISKRVQLPVILAGGLNPNNIVAAIEEVEPWAVDLCSGLRTDGQLDLSKLNLFSGQI